MMEGKIFATNIDNEVMIFDTMDDYQRYQVEMWNQLFENSFTNSDEVKQRYGIKDTPTP